MASCPLFLLLVCVPSVLHPNSNGAKALLPLRLFLPAASTTFLDTTPFLSHSSSQTFVCIFVYLQHMNGGNNDGVHQIPLVKNKHRQHRQHDPIMLSAHETVPHKPSARNTPMLSFQPHHTEISTDRPSVSGRLLLHIPKIPLKKFHFVSMTLHLRLKEAIGWTRQDLVTFELENQGWSQTVWDKKIQLAFQDRQVEEGDDTYIAVVREPANHSNSEGLGTGRIEVPADEWRWEWLLPVTDEEVRPESFEGSMGNVWYELEAKCLFRWDDVDQDGNMKAPGALYVAESSVLSMGSKSGQNHAHGSGRVQSASNLLKGLEGPSKSLASAFGKLRVGQKTKKIQYAGDFKVENKHDEFIKQSLRKRNENLLLAKELQSGTGAYTQDQDYSNNEPLPFLIRKILKLYFIKPPPSASSSPSFFLPPPSMALPTLPGTRRLKAIIPSARIQVQIQIPSLIPIRGYAQTSQLIPDSKKGGLVLSKQGQQQSAVGGSQNKPSAQERLSSHSRGIEVDPRYLDNFQVALTVRKLTEQEIDKSELLKKRYQNVGTTNNMSPNTSASSASGRKRLVSGPQHLSDINVNNQYPHASESEIGGSFQATTIPTLKPERKTWRKELRVRKVKCEFWQKESCRIPTGSSNGKSRTVKFALAPAFTYSDKEQERDRIRSSVQLQPLGGSPRQTTIAWDNAKTSSSSTTGRSDTESSPSITIRPVHPSGLSGHPSPAITRGHDEGFTVIQPSASPAPPRPTIHTVQQNNSLHPSKPFMLLIPIPLDSPRLRQTFAWPSVETPSPIVKKFSGKIPVPVPYAGSPRTRSSSSPVGDGPMAYPSTQAIYDMAMMGTAGDLANDGLTGLGGETVTSRSSGWGAADSEDADELECSEERRGKNAGAATAEMPRRFAGMARVRDDIDDIDGAGAASQELYNHVYHQHHHGDPQEVERVYRLPSAAKHTVKSRIEVKHYLSLRLSIDVLEYEGEFEQDYQDLDLEAIEEHQLQLVRIRQELSAYGSSMSVGSIPSRGDHFFSRKEPGDTGARSPGSDLKSRLSTSERTPSILSEHTSRAASVHTTSSSGSVHALTATVAPSMSTTTTMQPALTFLNSTVGLLDPDSEFDFQKQGSGFRAASSISSRSGQSEKHSSGAASGPAALVVGALEALKKKASSTALNAMANMATGNGGGEGQSPLQSRSKRSPSPPHQVRPSSHWRTKSSAVLVQKLKDFVIRVPISVVIQVDDLYRVGAAGRQAASSGTGTQDLMGEGGTSTEHDHDSGDGIRTATRTDTGPSSRDSMVDGGGTLGNWQNQERRGVQGAATQGPITVTETSHLRMQGVTACMPTACSTAESESVVSSGLGSELKSSSTVDSIENDYYDDDDAEYVEARFIPDHL